MQDYLKRFFTDNGWFALALVVIALGFFIVGYSGARGEEAPVCASPVSVQVEYAATLPNVTVARMEGTEMRAFESIVKSLAETFRLETATTAVYFFTLQEQGMTLVMEVDANGCILTADAVATEVVKNLIAKMSATM